MREKLLLIDGYSILFRNYHALSRANLKNAQGVPTGAITGFLTEMLMVTDDIKPDYIAVAFDVSAPTFRHKMYPEYKAGRPPMEENMKTQVPIMREIIEAMNIKILELEGYEADDIIGTMSVMAAKKDIDTYILSGDRDLFQLVNDKVTQLYPMNTKTDKGIKTCTPEYIKEKFGYMPGQVTDIKAIAGDKSDNIKGIEGLGDKWAIDILSTYETLENAYEHYEELTPKRKGELLREKYEDALFSKKLATICPDVPVSEDFSPLKTGEMFNEKSRELFREMDLNKFKDRFQSVAEENPRTVIITVKSIDNPLELMAIKGELLGESRMSLGLDIDRGEIKGLALSGSTQNVYIKAGNGIEKEDITDFARELLEKVPALSSFDFKEQGKVLQADFNDRLFDCKIAAYLLDPNRGNISYEYVAKAYGGVNLPGPEDIVGKKITKSVAISDEQRECILENTVYAAEISAEGLESSLKKEGMEDLFKNIEMPLIFTLKDMEDVGIGIDKDKLVPLSERLQEKMGILENEIYREAGREFNILSPKQLGEVLFDEMKIPLGRNKKRSTDEKTLSKIAPDYPIGEHILSYRRVAKLKGTYADALGEYVRDDGRIHSSFNQTVTATGRISSSDPNMQNIPVRTQIGRDIREMFVPREGYIFIDGDYSQIELRVMAHLSGDERLISDYNEGNDIHARTASAVFNVPIDMVTAEQRRKAKAVNFGIIYGISAYGLSEDLQISPREGKEYINKYFEMYPMVKDFLEGQVKKAKETGVVTTMFGRIRPIEELKSGNYMIRQFGERVAMNSPVQGTAADIIKIAMNNVNKRIKKENLKTELVLQVHDELLLEAPLEEAEYAEKMLREEMEQAAVLRVRLVADVHRGSNWNEAH